MRENEEITKNFIFRLGKLHIPFAFLKVIGKYVQGSCIAQVLIEAGIYGMTTLGHILEGKHLKRAMEVHMVIYLSLCKIYLEQLFGKHPETSQPLTEIISSLLQINLEEIKMDHVDASVTALKKDGILETFENFDQNLQQEARFLRNYMVMYMVMYEILLHLVRAMIPYFFKHDQTNYARHSPLYLATMKELEHNDSDSWNYLKENFSINKS